MRDTRRRAWCAHPSCSKYPTYGVEASKTKKFCAGHAKEGMVNTMSKRCGHPNCKKQPSYGVEGNKTTVFCLQHAKEGMVDTMTKTCDHPLLQQAAVVRRRRQQDDGVLRSTCEEGHGERQGQDMRPPWLHEEPLVRLRAAWRGIARRRSSVLDTRRREGNVKDKTCGHPSYKNQLTYGAEGSKTAEFCSQHAKEGMVRIYSERRGHP